MKPNYRIVNLVTILAVLGAAYLVYYVLSAREAARLAKIEDEMASLTVVDEGPSAQLLNAAGVQLFLHTGEAWKAGETSRAQGRMITKVIFTTPESITETNVNACDKFLTLSYVSCFDVPLTKDQLRVLSRLRKGALDLNYTGIDDEALRSLDASQPLTALLLNGTRVTDEGMAKVASMPALATLTLYDTSISDQGLDHLAAVKTLKILDVQRTQVTLAGVDRFRQALPTCLVYYDPY